MVVATSAVDESSAQGPTASGVARMNRAAQQLESMRAALGRSGNAEAGASNSQGADEDAEDGRETPAAPSAESDADTRDVVKVASAPASAGQTLASGARMPDAAAQEAPDSSGIPPSSRRMLIIVAAVIAVSLVVYRFARKSAR